jgi:transcriptional regulator with XRE-family HTH domain
MLVDMDVQELAERVATERKARRWSVETAAREAGINRVTWKRIESGLAVQDVKRRAVEDALGLREDSPAPLTSAEAADAAQMLSSQLNRRLLDFTDFELLTELHARMVLMASRLHASGDDMLTFVIDPGGENIITSRPGR